MHQQSRLLGRDYGRQTRARSQVAIPPHYTVRGDCLDLKLRQIPFIFIFCEPVNNRLGEWIEVSVSVMVVRPVGCKLPRNGNGVPVIGHGRVHNCAAGTFGDFEDGHVGLHYDPLLLSSLFAGEMIGVQGECGKRLAWSGRAVLARHDRGFLLGVTTVPESLGSQDKVQKGQIIAPTGLMFSSPFYVI
jgi:hypothetical protein